MYDKKKTILDIILRRPQKGTAAEIKKTTICNSLFFPYSFVHHKMYQYCFRCFCYYRWKKKQKKHTILQFIYIGWCFCEWTDMFDVARLTKLEINNNSNGNNSRVCVCMCGRHTSKQDDIKYVVYWPLSRQVIECN